MLYTKNHQSKDQCISCLSRLSVDCGEVLCPNLQLETQAGRSFDTNISIFNCSSMCDGVVCVTNVSGVDNYTISINDCLTIGVSHTTHMYASCFLWPYAGVSIESTCIQHSVANAWPTSTEPASFVGNLFPRLRVL